ncbi:23 kDa integral membrane protein-like [Armigeres subalbatus]|uniref:23 kDa integral membrane protein-like n=1 Tax=Armigeres subalbatus TaxID=124917 RepID=UPI002ED296B6
MTAVIRTQNSQLPPPYMMDQQQQPQAISRKALSMIKYFVLVLTGMCLILEVIQIVIGARASNLFSDLHIFLNDNFISLTAFILAVGIIMLIFVLFGCIGIILENMTIIAIYIALFSIVAVLEIIVAISAYVMGHQIDDMLTVTMNGAFSQYPYDPNVRDTINNVQRTFECCGVHSYTDWYEILMGTIPPSCHASAGSTPFQQGCFHRVHQVISYMVNLMASGTTVIIIFQIICIISAVVFLLKLKGFKRQQWALQNSPSATGYSGYNLNPIMQEKPRF